MFPEYLGHTMNSQLFFHDGLTAQTLVSAVTSAGSLRPGDVKHVMRAGHHFSQPFSQNEVENKLQVVMKHPTFSVHL
jgi:hypothetical protein